MLVRRSDALEELQLDARRHLLRHRLGHMHGIELCHQVGVEDDRFVGGFVDLLHRMSAVDSASSARSLACARRISDFTLPSGKPVATLTSRCDSSR